MESLKYLNKTNESKTIHLSTPNGLSVFTINTILTYKTKDGYTGYIVKVKENNGDI
jgi:hypothetical protein